MGIRTDDCKRYYYYAHREKDHTFAEGLKEGDHVMAGDVIGCMGRSGYSIKENVNNIDEVHLHFGLELVFDEFQKECNSEIWTDVYDIVCLLEQHRSSVAKNKETGQGERLYPYRDLDAEDAAKRAEEAKEDCEEDLCAPNEQMDPVKDPVPEPAENTPPEDTAENGAAVEREAPTEIITEHAKEPIMVT